MPSRQASAASGTTSMPWSAPARRGGVPLQETSAGANRRASVRRDLRPSRTTYSAARRHLPILGLSARSNLDKPAAYGRCSAREGARALQPPEGGHAGSPPSGTLQPEERRG